MLLASVAQTRGQARLFASSHAANAKIKRAASQVPPAKAERKPVHRKSMPLFPTEPGEYDNRLWKPLFKHLVSDQYAIWTSPKNLHVGDAGWLVPFGGLAAALFSTDQQFSRHLSNSPSRLNNFDNFSTYGAYSMVGSAAAMYLWGHFTHNEHMRETGFLSGEVLIDSLAVTEALKYTFQRARPLDPGPGDFWNGGTSFPSEHSTAAWSLAGVMAHEYPGLLTKILAYGMASAISISRVPAKKHFPSDVLIGGMIGYLVARHVYLAHHDPELGGGTWRLFPGLNFTGKRLQRSDMGSPYVPLDSWVYPAFERLIAMGYVRSAMLGMRPWTRLECVRLLEQAEDRIGPGNSSRSREARPIIRALQREFKVDLGLVANGKNRNLELDSLYTRVTGISGKPLTDGFDFGQTLYNDFGRPYEEGTNAIAGFTGWGTAGPLVAYVDAEYQHSPSAPPLPPAARTFISQNLGLSPMPALTTQQVDRMDLLEGYVGFTFHNWEISAGKQSIWWGPDSGSSLIYSDNAEPLDMVRINRVSPFKLPSILGLMGPIRMEFFIGQQHGAQFIFNPSGLVGQWGQDLSPQPIIHGEELSFKPTPNLEFGFDRTTIYGGPGYPLTIHTFLRSMFSLSNEPAGAPNKPGDRQSGFDMTYRLPFLRNWVTFYVQSFNDDEISPVAYFDKSINSAGLYFDRLPGLPKFDLRLEGLYSNLPIGGNEYQHGYFYANDTWRYGQRNAGNLFTSWIGREGQGEQGWLTYWRTPRNDIQLQYRHQKVGADFVPGGGTINDGGIKADWWFKHHLEVSGLLQYERWDFPILAPGQQTDFTTQVGVTYWPQWSLH